MERDRLIGVLNGVLAGALWGLVFLAPILTPGFTAPQISAARYLAYGTIALVLVIPSWKKLRAKLTRRDWLALAWLGLAGNIIYYIFLATAVRLAGPAPASLIVGLLPVLITIAGSREEGAIPFRRLAPPLVLAVAGTALISAAAFSKGAAHAPWQDQAIGLGCAVGALLSWAVFAVGNTRAIARLPQVSSHDWSLLLGIVTGAECLVMLPLFFIGAAHPQSAWQHFWLVSSGIALAASVIGNALWNSASRRLPLTMTAQLVVFETLFALIYSFAWEARAPTALEAVAIASLLTGVWWCVGLHRTPPLQE